MPKRVSVVILTWNNLEHLKQFLPLLLERTQDDSIEIIIADNHSKDHTTTWITDHYPGIRLLTFKKNLGYAGGYAAALSQIHSEFFLLLNSDVEVLPGWLPPLVEVMEDTDVAAVMPKILSKKDPRYFEYAGAAGGWIDRYGYPFCRGRIFNTLEKDTHQYDQIIPVFWASGACMLVRRESYLEAGGFDPDFFAHMEEIDLCWRFQKRGLKILYQPHSTVLHVG
ncbi:MAG: glycosyltransferase family 2 protein, partial [Bacteroidales bacterium]|nr:glycosyltransferase family 2 protein [Bacteroidales bacterium]